MIDQVLGIAEDIFGLLQRIPDRDPLRVAGRLRRRARRARRAALRWQRWGRRRDTRWRRLRVAEAVERAKTLEARADRWAARVPPSA